ncbi:MAG: hypothetical protein ABL895_21450 [Cyclobacteriaceae bacterium]
MRGKVTFVTSINAYIKFETTKNIEVGDTLFLYRGNIYSPCLIVKNKSSMSCVAELIKGCEMRIDDEIVHRTNRVEKPGDNEPVKITTGSKIIGTPKSRKNYRGVISAASYSSFSAAQEDVHRTMYRLSFDANHIDNSKFSVETYMNYRQTFRVKDSISTRDKDIFNIYSLAVRYDVSPTMSISLGRKINQKASSLGAMDGLQAEKFFGNFYMGMLVGFRPDIYDYTFNKDLFQYGGYVGIKSENKTMYSQTTLGLMEQDNNGNVDRRYSYFQHSSTIGQKLTLFSSFELDLYNKVNADSMGPVRLTNLYVSVGYQLAKWIDLNVSYDSRKQIIYYETLKTEIERILDNDEARQGIRYRLNLRPVKFINIGANYSRRFQSNDLNVSDNINAYFNWSKVPGLGGMLFINYNDNKSSYLESKIFSFRHSRTIIKDRLDADIYYRIANYTYSSRELVTNQKYYGAGLSYRVAKKMTLSVLGELSTLSSEEDNYRVNARISKNF